MVPPFWSFSGSRRSGIPRASTLQVWNGHHRSVTPMLPASRMDAAQDRTRQEP